MKKLFILGVGAQKGGTTWLHRQLNDNSNVDFGFRKEYHIFDAVGQARPGSDKKDASNCFRNKRIKKILEFNEAGQLGRNLGSKRKRSKHIALELAFLDNLDHYFDYFDHLYLKNPDVEAVGDITPNYAIVKPSIFRMAKRRLEEKGFTVKVFFLMRDPVERAWSLARMKKRETNEENQSFNEIDCILNAPIRDCINTKSRYENTINNLEKIFNPTNIYYGFYETLFDKERHSEFEDFLDMRLRAFNPSEILNASPKTKFISTELNQEIAAKFKTTYEFMLNRFGPSMRSIWQGYKFCG